MNGKNSNSSFSVLHDLTLQWSGLRSEVDEIYILNELGFWSFEKWLNGVGDIATDIPRQQSFDVYGIGGRMMLISRDFDRFFAGRFSGSGSKVKTFEFTYEGLVSTTTDVLTITTVITKRFSFWNCAGKRPKLSAGRVAYYSNTTATRRILLIRAGDVEQNPGWQDATRHDSDYLQDFAREIGSGSNNLSVAHLNIRSLRNKLDEVKVLMQVCRFDILAITETHLDRKISNKQLEIDNYKIVRRETQEPLEVVALFT